MKNPQAMLTHRIREKRREDSSLEKIFQLGFSRKKTQI